MPIFAISEVTDELRGHVFALKEALTYLADDLVAPAFRTELDWRDMNIDSLPVTMAVKHLYTLYESRVFDEDVYEQDDLSLVDHFYQLVTRSDEAVSHLPEDAPSGALLWLINWHNVQNDIQSSGQLSMEDAADLAGIKTTTLRSLLFSRDYSALTPVKDESGRTCVDYEQFRLWVRERRNADLRAVAGCPHPLDGMPDLDANDRPTAETIRRLLRERHGFVPHAAMNPANKKMHAYRAADGRTVIAHEHNGRSQGIWVPLRPDSNPDTIPAALRGKFYAGAQPSCDAAPRHSGLRKYPELATASLAKFLPATLGEADEIIRFALDQ